MVSNATINDMAQRLVDDFNPERIILFGSQVNGTADEHSDVDILVICPISSSRRAMMVAMDRAMRGLGVARDIMVLSPQEYETDRHIPGTVARNASRHGRTLYERN